MMDLVRSLGRRVMGVLSGFDRVLFRGILNCVVSPRGLNGYLYGVKVPMNDFEPHAKEVSSRILQQSFDFAKQAGCEARYIEDSHTRKQDVALEIAQAHGIQSGPVCVLRAVEPCRSFAVKRDRQTKTIELVSRKRKCLHLYHYFNHERFGLMHVRLQTWFPFTIQVCMNGREWLIRSLEAAGIDYARADNCVCRVADLDAAQCLLNEQLTTDWRAMLDGLRRQVHPAHEDIFANCPESARHYYWSVAESEWASDILFHDSADVLPVCQRLVEHSMRVHGAGHIMKFLGRTTRKDGFPRSTFQGWLQSDVKDFEQGLRIKHRLNANSVKMYNRPGVLRIETTINNPGEFKVWRTTASNPDGDPDWLRLRKGVADLHRRVEVSQASNDRFARAQAAELDQTQRLSELASSLCSRVRRPGRRKADGTTSRPRSFRALNPFSPDDIRLLQAIGRGEFAVSGLQNQDLRRILYGDDPRDRTEKRRRSSRVSRLLSLLRAHGVLEKVSKSHRYRVTSKGQQSLRALLAAANATTGELTKLAA